MDTRPGFICIASIWPDSPRAVTKRITQIKTQMGPQYHFIQGTVRRGFVSNRHGVLEFSSCGAHRSVSMAPFAFNVQPLSTTLCFQPRNIGSWPLFFYFVSRRLPGPGPGAPGPPHTCPRWGPDWWRSPSLPRMSPGRCCPRWAAEKRWKKITQHGFLQRFERPCKQNRTADWQQSDEMLSSHDFFTHSVLSYKWKRSRFLRLVSLVLGPFSRKKLLKICPYHKHPLAAFDCSLWTHPFSR